MIIQDLGFRMFNFGFILFYRSNLFKVWDARYLIRR